MDEVELLPCIPTPEMIAAAWTIIDRSRSGVAKLGAGLGIREVWQAMFHAAPTIVTDEVVERVARAVNADRTKRHYHIDRGADEAWEALTDYHREEMLHTARAAISALPTIDQDGGE